MAGAYSNKGELDKALKYYHKSLVIRLKTIGETHPSVIIFYINIANVYTGKGEFDKAL